MFARKYKRAGKFVTAEVNVGVKILVATHGMMLPGRVGKCWWGEVHLGQKEICCDQVTACDQTHVHD